ncbi:MAG: carbamoyltransferase [Bacteroidetes bacterium]|nr:carbamoyltransferase [Bacteroidota bacterium]MBL6944498.1 carbamoyltransferase [Bacteroidales bacterium]
MSTAILGISAYYHDSAAALIIDGEIIAAAQEERFTRKKHDSSFPINAAKYVLTEAGIEYKDLTAISFYDKPFIKFERLLETYHAFAPKGLISFLSTVPVWIKEKLFMKKMLNEELAKLGKAKIRILFPEHHLSHAASAFYPSPFEEAAILTIDGVGEWATSTIGYGKDNEITILKELHFPHSIGLLYSAFTYYTGFRVNSGEYKLMGLAPYGDNDSVQTREYKEKILHELVDIREDGSILLNMKYFGFATGLKMTDDKKWTKLFGLPPRNTESEITQPYMNLALAIQQVTEEIVLKLAKTAKGLTKSDYLVMAGGVVLNSVANGKIIESGLFKDIWIQPAAGDAGGALGAAYLGWYLWKGEKRIVNKNPDAMKGAYLGPEFDEKSTRSVIRKYNAQYEYFNNFNELIEVAASKISEGNVVGWFQGRMEYGPRALGNRSILGDARNPEMQKKMNLKIKYREGFRPFAPSVLEEDIKEYFVLDTSSPYMLLVIPVNKERLLTLPEGYNEMELYDRLYQIRSDIPAITHIDYSARIQSVNKNTNPQYWKLINEFKKQTGYGVVVNTSFNVRGEPIVCTPDEAFRCFMRTEMDYLVIGNYLFEKNQQGSLINDSIWQEEFKLD